MPPIRVSDDDELRRPRRRPRRRRSSTPTATSSGCARSDRTGSSCCPVDNAPRRRPTTRRGDRATGRGDDRADRRRPRRPTTTDRRPTAFRRRVRSRHCRRCPGRARRRPPSPTTSTPDDAPTRRDRRDDRAESPRPSRRRRAAPPAAATPARERRTAAPAATSAPTTIPPSGELLAALRRDHRPPPRLGALDVRLLVGDRRPPAVRLQPVVGDEPRVRACSCAGRAGSGRAGSASAAPPTTSADAIGQLDPRPRAAERAHPLAGDPAVGRDVEHAVEALVDGEDDGRGEVVEVEELGRRVVLAEALAEPGGERAGERGRAVGGHRHDRAQHGDGAARALPAPAVGHRLDRRPAGGRRRTRRRGAGWRPR